MRASFFWSVQSALPLHYNVRSARGTATKDSARYQPNSTVFVTLRNGKTNYVFSFNPHWSFILVCSLCGFLSSLWSMHFPYSTRPYQGSSTQSELSGITIQVTVASIRLSSLWVATYDKRLGLATIKPLNRRAVRNLEMSLDVRRSSHEDWLQQRELLPFLPLQKAFIIRPQPWRACQ